MSKKKCKNSHSKLTTISTFSFLILFVADIDNSSRFLRVLFLSAFEFDSFVVVVVVVVVVVDPD